MGRVSQQSNPAEINGSTWNPAGLDSAGWAWRYQTYDWQSRPLVTTNQDGTTKIVSYDGCGCAGGQTVSVKDEGDGVMTGNPPQLRRRQQKIYHDVLGRVTKPEVREWNNGNVDGNVYSTMVNTYNVRDQVIFQREFQGSTTPSQEADTTCPSSLTCKRTKLVYDGHGRLKERWLPIYQASPDDPNFTASTTPYDAYSYNTDDTLQAWTDPRGASATMLYNSRGLLTNVNYGTPPAGVPVTPNVSFQYDQNGNRTYMDDGPGWVSYHYDTLSRMDYEQRKFDDGPTTFQINYGYNLAGQLQSITDPFGVTISYSRDKAGRVTGMSGSGLANLDTYNNQTITQVASGITYRAWGAIKQMDNGNVSGKNHFEMTYDARLRLVNFEAAGRTTTHTYFDDNKIKTVQGSVRPNFNATYAYDFAERLQAVAAGNDPDWRLNPYQFSYSYTAFGNLIQRQGHHWALDAPSAIRGYVNGREYQAVSTVGTTIPLPVYDKAGNMLKEFPAASTETKYDSVSQQPLQRTKIWLQTVNGVTPTCYENQQRDFDGDGVRIKTKFFYDEFSHPNETQSLALQNSPVQNSRNYFITSTVLGGKPLVVAWTNANFAQEKGASIFYLNGLMLGQQIYTSTSSTGNNYRNVQWHYLGPVNGSRYVHNKLNTLVNNQVVAVDNTYADTEIEPTGRGVALTDPGTTPPPPSPPGTDAYTPNAQEGAPEALPWYYLQQNQYHFDCYVDRVLTPCWMAIEGVNRGTHELSQASLDHIVNNGNPLGLLVYTQKLGDTGVTTQHILDANRAVVLRTAGTSTGTTGLGQQGGGQQKQPCDAEAPTNPDIYAGVVTAMHEHTAFQYAEGNHRQFTNAAVVNLGTGGKQARANSAEYRSGDVINFHTLIMEAAAFATATYNSFESMLSRETGNKGKWPTWGSYLRYSGRFGGPADWTRGVDNLDAALASSADSTDCAYLKGAIAIFSSVYTAGRQSPFYRSSTINGWRGIFQPPARNGGNFFLRAPSGTRIGDHDFIP